MVNCGSKSVRFEKNCNGYDGLCCCSVHGISEKSTAQTKVQMQIVEQLENQVKSQIVECQK